MVLAMHATRLSWECLVPSLTELYLRLTTEEERTQTYLVRTAICTEPKFWIIMALLISGSVICNVGKQIFCIVTNIVTHGWLSWGSCYEEYITDIREGIDGVLTWLWSNSITVSNGKSASLISSEMVMNWVRVVERSQKSKHDMLHQGNRYSLAVM